MTIDKAIRQLENRVEIGETLGLHSKIVEENRQLAQWLKELKAYRECKLTDKEQRIFSSAMHREYEVCKEIDNDLIREPYEDNLTYICNQIRKKVKEVLF